MEKKFHFWSSPRACSTALMYSFSSHSDFTVFDEPLYSACMYRDKNQERPYKSELLASQAYGATDSNTPLIEFLTADRGTKFTFFKHMAKHYPLLNNPEGIKALSGPNHVHVLLIRNPLKTIMSWSEAVDKGNTQKDALTLAEIGLNSLLIIYDTYENVIVVDSDQVIENPESTLKCLCKSLSVPFSEKMMSWEAGPKPFGGIWAKWWYASAHRSTGWSKSATKSYKVLKPELLPLVRMCNAFYGSLKPFAIGEGREGKNEKENKNTDVLCWVGQPSSGRLFPREQATLSVFDSIDYERAECLLRVAKDQIYNIDEKLSELCTTTASYKNTTHSIEQIKEAVFQTLAINGMRDGADVKVLLTKGVKDYCGTTLVVIAEWWCDNSSSYAIEGVATDLPKFSL